MIIFSINVCLMVMTVSEFDELTVHVSDTINEMMVCNDRAALQVLMVSGGTFNAFISLLQQTSVSKMARTLTP